MKLIFCPECEDIVKLQLEHRSCRCGKSGGMYYRDGTGAMITGAAIPIGIHNSTFAEAIRKQPSHGRGKEFTAFVIPKNCAVIDRC